MVVVVTPETTRLRAIPSWHGRRRLRNPQSHRRWVLRHSDLGCICQKWNGVRDRICIPFICDQNKRKIIVAQDITRDVDNKVPILNIDCRSRMRFCQNRHFASQLKYCLSTSKYFLFLILFPWLFRHRLVFSVLFNQLWHRGSREKTKEHILVVADESDKSVFVNATKRQPQVWLLRINDGGSAEPRGGMLTNTGSCIERAPFAPTCSWGSTSHDLHNFLRAKLLTTRRKICNVSKLV